MTNMTVEEKHQLETDIKAILLGMPCAFGELRTKLARVKGRTLRNERVLDNALKRLRKRGEIEFHPDRRWRLKQGNPT